MSKKAKKTDNKEQKYVLIIGIVLACVVVLAIVLGIIFALGDSDSGTASNTQPAASKSTQSIVVTDEKYLTKPIVELSKTATYYADIDVKNLGMITVKLDQNAAPITVSNFINLSNGGFYDGLTFHRILEGFMMQGGDPKGNGSGGSKQNILGEFALNGVENNISHKRGVISMGRLSNDNNSASSQFFIVHKDSVSLDGQYAAFGEVESGMEIVDKICTDARPLDNNGTIAKSAQPIINSIRVRTVE